MTRKATGPAEVGGAYGVGQRVGTRVAVSAGAVCCVIGSTTMLAWHAHVKALLIITPMSTPMRYNAALAFLLCGVGLIASAWKRSRITLGSAAAVGVIGVVTALEYLLGKSFGIDVLLFDQYAIGARTVGARMAPNTAVAFITASAALLLLARRNKSRWGSLVAALLASVTFVLGVVAAIGYATSLEVAYSWGNLTGMSLIAAIGLLSLGMGMLGMAWRAGQRMEKAIPSWAPLPLVIILASMTALLWHAVLHVRGARGNVVADLVLAAGLGMAVLTAVAVRLAQVTATKNHELHSLSEQLEAQQFYSRSLLEASLDPLVTISREGKITDVNQATEAVTGIPRERLIGSDFCDYFTEPQQARAGYKQVFAEGYVHDYPLAIRHVTGQITDVLYNATVFRNQAGEVQGVFAAARDVTERRKAEKALQAGEERYRSLVTATAQIVWTTDANGLVTTDMPTWRAFTGSTVKQLPGWGWIESVHAEDRARAAEVWRSAVASKSLYETEFRLRRSDGEYRHMWVRGVPVIEADGETVREWVGTCTDITARKQADEEIKRYAAELERSNAELQDFASIASHDLQEPLRKVLAFGEHLKDHLGSNLDELGSDFLARMQNAAKRMSVLIEALLAYSRVASRAQPMERVDLLSVLLGVLPDLEERIAKTHARIEFAPLPKVMADPMQVRQVIQNLLGNALKFQAPGTTPQVEITGKINARGWCEITVRDNGIGFDEKYLDRIFRPFQRLHGRNEYEGSGMGLAICRKVVARHGGTITAHSRPGAGATFVVTLPAKTEAAETGEHERSEAWNTEMKMAAS
ncbi:MAG: sensor histidine kinase [Terriglobales bacterium]